MRASENMEKLIKKLRFNAGDETHKRVLGNVLQALEDSEQQPAKIQPNIRRKIMKSPITKLAAAAVIIIAVFIGIDQLGTNGSSVVWADVAERFESVPF
jgi:hypothetical protein